MRLLFFSFLLLLGGCSRPAPPSGAGTTFAKQPAVVGQKREKTSVMKLEASLRTEATGGKANESAITKHERSRRTDEVLAVTGGSVTKLKVTIDDREPFVVEGERAVDPVTAALPDTPLTAGQKVDALAKAIGARMKDRGEGLEVSHVDVTFDGAKGDDGVFDVAMKLSKTEGPIALTMDLKGKMHVSTKTGLPASTHLEGPVTVGGGPPADAAVKVHGTGTVTIDIEEK